MLVRPFWHTGARFVTGNYKRGSSVTEMKKGVGVGIIGEEKESEQGLHFTSSPMGRLAIPTQTILRPVLRSSRHSQFIQIATNKNSLKYSFMPRTVIDWNSIPVHIKELKTKTSLKKLLPNISASNQISQQRNCTNPTRSTPFRGVE